MRTRRMWSGMATVALAGAVALVPATSAWAAGRPTISAVDTGSGIMVQGTNVTPGGTVTVTEWAQGTKAPYWTIHGIVADANGDYSNYAVCDGNTALRFQAKDDTTGHKSKKTHFATFTCVF